MTTPPCPRSIIQFDICIFSQLIFSWLSSVPALIAIQSSPEWIVQFKIFTFLLLFGLIPSVFGESHGFWIVTPSTLTSLHRNGCMVHAGEFKHLIPWISTLVQFSKYIICGLCICFFLKSRYFSHHTFPWPSRLPFPFIAILWAFFA